MANIDRFQWTHLQIKQILKLETEAAIRDRLGKLPSGLTAAYKEMYENIQRRNHHDRVLVDRAIMWVMCAAKPLRTEGTLGSCSSGCAQKQSGRVTADSTNRICCISAQDLLVLDSQLEVWRFAHLSVVEYFEEHHHKKHSHEEDPENKRCYDAFDPLGSSTGSLSHCQSLSRQSHRDVYELRSDNQDIGRTGIDGRPHSRIRPPPLADSCPGARRTSYADPEPSSEPPQNLLRTSYGQQSPLQEMAESLSSERFAATDDLCAIWCRGKTIFLLDYSAIFSMCLLWILQTSY